MNVEFTSKGWEGLTFWIENDEEIVIKIKNLIKSILREPYTKGKDQKCTIIQCRFHYD